MLSFELTTDLSATHVSCGQFISQNNSVHPKRCMDEFVLLVGYKGEMPISQEGRNYILKRGNYIILFPKHIHYGYAPTSDSQSHFWCHFSLNSKLKLFEDEFNSKSCLPEYGKLSSPERIFIIFNQMLDVYGREYINPDIQKQICDSFLNVILHEIFNDLLIQKEASVTDAFNVKRKALIFKISQWIKLHYSEDLSSKAISENFQYNSDYIARLFRSDTGMTLKQYINTVRIKEAKKLLLNTDLHISEISYSVGFKDEKYFMKIFKNSEGITPTDYRYAYYHKKINHK